MKNYGFITDIIRKKSGIVLNEGKEYLVEGRLKPLARKNGFEDTDQLIDKIKATNDPKLIEEVIDAMTTNESLFFRDTKPFEQLEKIVMPEFQNKQMKIWSGAASTGQEIYSIAMTLEEKNFMSYNILGTDLSPSVIQRAQDGKYTQFEIQRGVPITKLVKYFTQDGDSWKINQNLKRNVRFQEYNLLNSFTALGRFDVVFCRNVLIYFDDETKTDIYNRIHQVLSPEGFLFVGSSESAYRHTDKFKPVEGATGLFRPV